MMHGTMNIKFVHYTIQSVITKDPNHETDRMHLQGETTIIGRFLTNLYHWLYKNSEHNVHCVLI